MIYTLEQMDKIYEGIDFFKHEGADTEDLLGKTFNVVQSCDMNNMILFENDEEAYVFYHEQDCCEHVEIGSIVGDLQTLVGHQLTMAECTVQDIPVEYESCTATFYKFATVKGYVTIDWRGYSNGYYSESVDLVRLTRKEFDEILQAQ